MANRRSATPRVYSYIRFSTTEQALGDSERRQLQAVRQFAKRQSMPFDESLRMTDRGLSGYHGAHRKKGVLGQFLKDVTAGLVPKGSILVVENLDRLSREGALKALRSILFELWDNEIVLQTLSPEESYAQGCDNDPKFLGLLLYLQRAQNESATKSERITRAWEQKRKLAFESKTPLTGRAPAWLTLDKAKNQYIVDPQAATVIQLIFDLSLQGIGKERLAKKLNAEALWFPPKNAKRKSEGWRASYIAKILTNRAVIGEYQPHARQESRNAGAVVVKRLPIGDPIPGYFDAIVNPDTFAAVQLMRHKGKGGMTGKASNLFAGFVKCAYCGGSMHFQDKGKCRAFQKSSFS